MTTFLPAKVKSFLLCMYVRTSAYKRELAASLSFYRTATFIRIAGRDPLSALAEMEDGVRRRRNGIACEACS